MTKFLIVDTHEEVAGSTADLLRDLGYEVATTAGDAVPGQFDAVLYVARDLGQRRQEDLPKMREAYPSAKIVVYSSELGLEVLARQIALTHAETLPMIKTIEEIAAALS